MATHAHTYACMHTFIVRELHVASNIRYVTLPCLCRSLAIGGGLPMLEYLDLSGISRISSSSLNELVAACPRLKPELLSYCDNIQNGPYPAQANGCLCPKNTSCCRYSYSVWLLTHRSLSICQMCACVCVCGAYFACQPDTKMVWTLSYCMYTSIYMHVWMYTPTILAVHSNCH